MLPEYYVKVEDIDHRKVRVKVSKDVYEYLLEAKRYEWKIERRARRHNDHFEMTDMTLYKESSFYRSNLLEDQYFQSEDVKAILDSLQLCSDKQRQRFIRYVLDCIPQTEIAREEGCEKQAASQSIAQAIKTIKKNLHS